MTGPGPADFDADVTIVAFEPRHTAAFGNLNIDWLERYFTVEDKDRKQIGDPYGAVIDKGGAILIAEDVHGAAVGCVALAPYAEHELELAKMAVAQTALGRGIGRKLMDAAVEQARVMGAKSIYLESNSALKPALSLYERSGFRHLEDGDRPKSPYARCDVYMRRPL